MDPPIKRPLFCRPTAGTPDPIFRRLCLRDDSEEPSEMIRRNAARRRAPSRPWRARESRTLDPPLEAGISPRKKGLGASFPGFQQSAKITALHSASAHRQSHLITGYVPSRCYRHDPSRNPSRKSSARALADLTPVQLAKRHRRALSSLTNHRLHDLLEPPEHRTPTQYFPVTPV